MDKEKNIVSNEKEITIGKTIFTIKSIFTNENKFEDILLDWAISKTVQTLKS